MYKVELRTGAVHHFRDSVELLSARQGKRNTLGLCLTTPGGQAEAVEKMVEIIRYHYEYFYTIFPRAAMSAGTILSMAADKIFGSIRALYAHILAPPINMHRFK